VKKVFIDQLRQREKYRRAKDRATPTLSTSSESESKTEESEKSEEPLATERQTASFSDISDFVTANEHRYSAFPIECLPGAAGEIAREVAASALVPETLTAMNVLGVLAASIGAGLEIASGGDRRTRANLFLLPSARSGTGKGQSFGMIAKPLLTREGLRLEEWRNREKPQISANLGFAESKLAQLKSEVKQATSSDAKQSLLTRLAETEAEIETARRLLREPTWSTEQATKEAIESLLEAGSREALASLSSEARGAVDVLMGRYRDATDESVFLASYSGDPIKIHRKSSRPILLRRPCLTILWAMQPDKLQEMLESPAMSESGLLPRFLLVDTKAEPQEEPEIRHCVPAPVAEAWSELVDELIDEYHEPDLEARVIDPTPSATAILRDYTNEIVRRRRKGGDLEDVEIYAARWAENAWRLSVVLHAAKFGADAWQEQLSEASASNAVLMMRWFSEQQLRILAVGRHTRSTNRLERLREVLSSKLGHQANLSELSRHHGIESDEVVWAAEKFPHVIAIEKLPSKGSGRPPVVARLK
jgi:hypothetical protein